MLSRISALIVLLSVVQYSSQQYWKNDKIVKQWQQLVPSNLGSGAQDLGGPSSFNNQPQPNNLQNNGLGSFIGSFVSGNDNSNQYAQPPPPPPPQPPQPAPQPSYQGAQVNFNLPVPVPAPAHPQQVVIPAQPIPVPVHPAQPGIAVAVPVGPYAIQQPTITNTGETIIENLIGGIPFDCHGRPTGHWRDGRYCDIFHACVFGQQRKTYACPFVGERTYFDEITRRCEFVNRNPLGCSSNVYYH